MAVSHAYAKLVFVRVEEFDPVLGAFGKWHAMPDIFMATVGARLALSGPSRDLELGAARAQTLDEMPDFNGAHGGSLAIRGDLFR
jgi:hypothetical protein